MTMIAKKKFNLENELFMSSKFNKNIKREVERA